MFFLFFLFVYIVYYGFADSLPPEDSSQSYHLIHLTKSGTVFYISLLMNGLVGFTVTVFSVIFKVVQKNKQGVYNMEETK